MLNLDRHMVASTEVCIHAGRQHFGKHADRRASILDPAHESGGCVSTRTRQDRVHELQPDITQRSGNARERFVNRRQHLGRRLLPDRLIPQRLEMVEHIVQHPMAITAQVTPRDGIERSDRAGFRHGTIF